jgi:ATP-dependent RNA helicase DeaD
MTFDTLGLNPKLLKAVASLGFEHPTPIQEKVIATVLGGSSDLVGLAQTGTGKTAAYGLPLVQLIDVKQPVTQALVICPTRELCVQISGDLKALARYTPQTHIVAVYGGAGIGPQVKQIKKGAHIIVATPGRLLDLMQRKAVRPGHIRYCVLDEADEMLSMGFQEEIDDIIKQMPTDRRIWLFSATMPSAAARIAKAYMQKPVEISIGRKNIGAENILHTYYVIREKERYAALKRLIDHVPGIYGLIFCRTRQDTRAVAEKLMKEGYNTDALHGDLSQEQRNHVMRKFRERALQVLVATDVAARGLDVDDISHVIQYNLPDDAERYTHRSGRTARAGKSGASLLLVNTREVRRIAELERRSGVTFSKGQVPSGSDICEKQLFAMVDNMARVRINDAQIAPYLQPVYEALGDMSRNELIQRFVSVEFNRFLDAYRDAGDLNVITRKELSRPNRDKRPTGRNSQSFYINVGRKDNIREGAIVRLICDRSGIRSDKIGQIALKGEFSFFDVDKCVAQKVFKALKGARLDDRKIDIRFADKPKIRSKKRKWRRKK